MKHNHFTIVFLYKRRYEKDNLHSSYVRYKAVINKLSESFQLFSVSQIEKLENGNVKRINTNYFITSYPYFKEEDKKWINASNFRSNEFLKTIGMAIENTINNVDKISDY